MRLGQASALDSTWPIPGRRLGVVQREGTNLSSLAACTCVRSSHHSSFVARTQFRPVQAFVMGHLRTHQVFGTSCWSVWLPLFRFVAEWLFPRSYDGQCYSMTARLGGEPSLVELSCVTSEIDTESFATRVLFPWMFLHSATMHQ